MWLLTPIGFFSIVCKPNDGSDGMLTVRSRNQADLENLREHWLPELGEILVTRGNDYRYRARAPREAVARAMSRAIEALDYDNFKSRVWRTQGSERAHVYGEVWELLHGLQGKAEHEQTVPVPPQG
ncbi:hypothetical protein X805_15030 [Sphaerotilus natans subsp. natans DSM 6575]|uniref:Uncharacterized protein n=1 Tax=Sphaerotilus natans subsp. natans DSM 6575 TaxID=1286631 RepID=A0A059KNU1_9BURK|nr:hypothetical protein [Sphaerotilus natans]KDB52899.1 hypothetical protein X805_15030 [Sphaerotilus natans subsp. natans DSM 6575]SIS05244.1 hypothetical protein SAMN05421778_13219 [Sphaerotilus natans]